MGFYHFLQTKTSCFGHKIMTISCENDHFHVIYSSICMSAIVTTILHNLHRKPGKTLKL